MTIFSTEKPTYAESIEECINNLESGISTVITICYTDAKHRTLRKIDVFSIQDFLNELSKLGVEYFNAYFYSMPF
jgi:hypothetical protein